MIVAGNAVPQGGKALVDALDHHFIGQAVPQVLDLWEHEKTMVSVSFQTIGLSVKRGSMFPLFLNSHLNNEPQI